MPFLQRHTNVQQDRTRCLTSLVTKQVQTKTTMRYHFTLPRMTIIFKKIENKFGDHMENLEAVHYWWECEVVQSLWKRVCWSSKNEIQAHHPEFCPQVYSQRVRE